MKVFLVCPAYRRTNLSSIVFDQWLWAKDKLSRHGVCLEVVVIANDKNLDLARDRGFFFLSQENLLGKKFNDGFEAAYSLGADYICPRGSDDWIHPDYILGSLVAGYAEEHNLPTPKHDLPGEYPMIITSSKMAWVNENASRIKEMDIGFSGRGCGPYLIPRRFFQENQRPLDNRSMRKIDNEYTTYFEKYHQPEWCFYDLGYGYSVDFKTPASNIWPYSSTNDKISTKEHSSVWSYLKKYYPEDLCKSMQSFYSSRKFF